jgi:hypothetical protein
LDGDSRTVLKVRRKNIILLRSVDASNDQSIHLHLSGAGAGAGAETPSLSAADPPASAARVSGSQAASSPQPISAAPKPGSDALLLRTFNSPSLRSEYGRVFEAGAARRVAEALAARGIDILAAGSESVRSVRERVVRLAWAVEEEILNTRRHLEHAALHRRFDGGGNHGGASRAGGGLEELDRATYAARRLLWVIDCLQYGEVCCHESQ